MANRRDFPLRPRFFTTLLWKSSKALRTTLRSILGNISFTSSSNNVRGLAVRGRAGLGTIGSIGAQSAARTLLSRSNFRGSPSSLLSAVMVMPFLLTSPYTSMGAYGIGRAHAASIALSILFNLFFGNVKLDGGADVGPSFQKRHSPDCVARCFRRFSASCLANFGEGKCARGSNCAISPYASTIFL